MTSPRPLPIAVALALAGSLVVAACGSSSKAGSATTTAARDAATTTAAPTTTAAAGPGAVTAAGIPAERCAANKAAGKITYLSGFDFAASASIVEVIVAKEKGYFDKMCLDVELKPSFSTANYPLIASNQAQFASGGSYSELVDNSKNGQKLAAVVIDGKTPNNALLVRDDGKVTALADLKGKVIGIKGAMPPALVAMLF
jgi:ABC-type nitrate/sulfonate/bicarbonate transport system substrate-binding protein